MEKQKAEKDVGQENNSKRVMVRISVSEPLKVEALMRFTFWELSRDVTEPMETSHMQDVPLSFRTFV